MLLFNPEETLAANHLGLQDLSEGFASLFQFPVCLADRSVCLPDRSLGCRWPAEIDLSDQRGHFLVIDNPVEPDFQVLHPAGCSKHQLVVCHGAVLVL